MCVCVYDCRNGGKCGVFGCEWIWVQLLVACFICRVCNSCACKGALDHSEIRDCPVRYMARRLQLVPWVKFTGPAIMGVNNPALWVTPLPV